MASSGRFVVLFGWVLCFCHAALHKHVPTPPELDSLAKAQVTAHPQFFDRRQITSTYYVTSITTIISCPSTYEGCPASSTVIIATSSLLTTSFSVSSDHSSLDPYPTPEEPPHPPFPSTTIEDYPSPPIETFCNTKFIDHYHTIRLPITIEKTIYVPKTEINTEYETVTEVSTAYDTITDITTNVDYETITDYETIIEISTEIETTAIPTTLDATITQISTEYVTITQPPLTSTLTTTITEPGTTQTLIITSVQPPITTTITGPPVTRTITITTTLPASTTTSLITSLVTLYPSSISIPASCARGCEVDATATLLTYPGQVSTSTVTSATRLVQVFVTGLPGGVNITSSTTTIRQLPTVASPVLSWSFSGVTLIYPTTYVAYVDFSHIFVETASTTCITGTEELSLPSPTNFGPLVYPEASIIVPGFPPEQLIDYLNGLSTVIEQLSGTPIGSSCDPIVGGTTTPITATEQIAVQVTTVPALFDETTIIYSEEMETSETETLPLTSTSTSTSSVTSSLISSPISSTTSPLSDEAPPSSSSLSSQVESTPSTISSTFLTETSSTPLSDSVAPSTTSSISTLYISSSSITSLFPQSSEVPLPLASSQPTPTISIKSTDFSLPGTPTVSLPIEYTGAAAPGQATSFGRVGIELLVMGAIALWAGLV